MLKYDMKLDTLSEGTIGIDLVAIVKNDYSSDKTKVEVKNYYTNDINLYDGASVSVVTILDKEDDFGSVLPIRYSEDVTIVSHDATQKTFSFIADKYIPLDLNGITIEMEDTALYLHFTFSSWHYFNKWDDYNIAINVSYPTIEGNINTITFYECQCVLDTELKWRYDSTMQGIDDFMCSIFKNDTYSCVGYGEYNEDVEGEYVEVNEIPEKACFTDELYLKKKTYYTMDCWRYELYEKSCNDGTLLGVTSNRENFRYENPLITEEYMTIPMASVDIPLSEKSDTNLYQEENLNTFFVDKEVEGAKNQSPEMEKYIYHPVFSTENGYKPIHKIKFNLHFREREEDGWIVKQDGYWNGMDSQGLHADVGSNSGFQFFSYKNVDKGRQSDCLSYLGFNDADVKYQKSKLKKSFLRLSFYDSMNRANQNLLCYATIFMDSGKLFARMMRGAKPKVEMVIGGVNTVENLQYVVSDQVGTNRYNDLKVNREPCFLGDDIDIEKVEEYRLSSQITVSDRLSQASSEGFYLYLWADNDNGVIPSDVYMRVEFNHAGYGRVIPFTMPYFSDERNGNANRIYTFEDIENEWLNNGGWGVRKNELFSYIHFKYAYDFESKRHVYYIDQDTYGIDSYYDDTPDELELNLYESKINFE